MGVKRRRGDIVLVIFGQGGLSVFKLRIFELVDIGEEHCWSDDGFDLL